MAILRILNSQSTGNLPPTLVTGQIGINEADKKLFYRNPDGTTGVINLAIYDYLLRFDAAQGLTAGQQSQGRSNLGATSIGSQIFTATDVNAVRALINAFPTTGGTFTGSIAANGSITSNGGELQTTGGVIRCYGYAGNNNMSLIIADSSVQRYWHVDGSRNYVLPGGELYVNGARVWTGNQFGYTPANAAGQTFSGDVNATGKIESHNWLAARNGVVYLSWGGHWMAWQDNWYYNFPHGPIMIQGAWASREGASATHHDITANSNMHISGNLQCNNQINCNQVYANGIHSWGNNNASGDMYCNVSRPNNVVSGGLTVNNNAVINGGVYSNGTRTRTGLNGGHTGNWFNFDWRYGYMIGYIDNSDLGGVMMTSDYRAKKNVKELSSTWEKVKKLRPISFEWKEFKPETQSKDAEPLFRDDDVENWGFLAHELQETLTPSAASGIKDDPVCVQSPNLHVVISALTKALQEAMERIETLEAKVLKLEAA